MVHRRSFLKRTLAAAGGVALVGGGLGLRRVYAVGRLRDDMMEQAGPAIDRKQQQEREQLPKQAQVQLSRYVHGLCLDCHKFADEVCSDAFQKRLDACDDDQRGRLFQDAFTQHVVTETKFEARVRTIAKQLGDQLDTNWLNCCAEVATTWGAAMRPYDTGFKAGELVESADVVIREYLQTAVRHANTKSSGSLWDIAEGIGESTLRLAFQDVWDYLMSFFRTRQANVQLAVSGKLSELSEKLGSGIGSDVRDRVATLHKWQYDSLESVAGEQASRVVGWI